MTLFHALVLGVIEGITEFLPVSSTFHMIVAAKFLGIPQDEFTTFFEVFIQAGAVLPLVVMFAKELLLDRKLLIKVVAGFIPAAVIGLILHKIIKSVFFSADWLMVAMFIGVGLLFILIEWLLKKQKLLAEKSLAEITTFESMKVGFFQALAVVPGVSRSGATMAGGMLSGLNRESAAKFSFLLAIPTIFAASALDLFQSREMLAGITSEQWTMIAVGFLSAMVVGWLCVKWLLGYLKQHGLAWFGWYRVIAGVMLLSWMLLK